MDIGERQFSGKKYLSYLKTSTKEGVTNLKDVNEDDVFSTIISTAEYRCCKMCRSKVEMQDNVLAACTKCSATMKIAYCKESKSAKFIVTQESGRDTTLSAFEPVLSRIVDGVSGQDLCTKLLSVSHKVFHFNDRNIVFSVQEK